MWKRNPQNLPNGLLNKFSLIHNQPINNANQQKLANCIYHIYNRTTTGKRSAWYQGYDYIYTLEL